MLRKNWQPNSRLLLGIRNAQIVENCEVILSLQLHGNISPYSPNAKTASVKLKNLYPID